MIHPPLSVSSFHHLRMTSGVSASSGKVSRLEPFRKVATSIREHWDGIVSFMQTWVTNGVIEVVNGLLQLAKRMARGFRTFRHFPS